MQAPIGWNNEPKDNNDNNNEQMEVDLLLKDFTRLTFLNSKFRKLLLLKWVNNDFVFVRF